MKNFAPIKALIAFWGWIAVVLLSFMLAILALGKGNLPDAVVFIVALVIFAFSLAVAIVNPGIFAKRHTTETGN